MRISDLSSAVSFQSFPEDGPPILQQDPDQGAMQPSRVPPNPVAVGGENPGAADPPPPPIGDPAPILSTGGEIALQLAALRA